MCLHMSLLKVAYGSYCLVIFHTENVHQLHLVQMRAGRGAGDDEKRSWYNTGNQNYKQSIQLKK